MRHHATAAATALASVLAAAAPAAADSYELGISGGANFLHSGSVDAIGDGDAQGVFRAHVAAGVPGLSLLGSAAEIELSWDHAMMSGDTFQTLDTDLGVDGFAASLRLRRHLWRRVSGYGRAGLALAFADLEIHDMASSAAPIRDEDWALGTVAALGADLHVVGGGAMSPVRVGLRAELGYQLMRSFHFDAARDDGDEDQLTIDTATADLGELDASGPTLRFGLYGRF